MINMPTAVVVAVILLGCLLLAHLAVTTREYVAGWHRRLRVVVLLAPVVTGLAWYWGFLNGPPTLGVIVAAGLLTWRRWVHNAEVVQRRGQRSRRKHGVASWIDVWRHGSAWKIRRKARVLRPSLADASRWELLRTARNEYAYRIARCGRFWIWGSIEHVTLIFGGPRKGKALALDTLVPTPSGWTTMGELRAGDELYDETGAVCRVVQAYAIRYDRPCYEVMFSDGSVIVADAEHSWQVETRAARKHGRTDQKVLTTREMLRDVRVESDGRANYSIPTAEPLQAAAAELPIEPYTLGAWLGDGTSDSGAITLGTGKAGVLSGIRAAGYEVTMQPWSGDRVAGCYTIRGLRSGLVAMELLGNKHIPAVYFRASEAQRRALLAGLLDTDGTCEKQGNIVFTSTREQLARDVRSLTATLGYKSTLTSRPALLYGKDCGTAWEVTFCPGDPVFRLARKAERQSAYRRVTNRRRYIVDIRPVASVPVRCIAVDSPSSLFLVGDQCITTHNSGYLAARILEAPGCVVSASTRSDLYDATGAKRAERGPVYVFNPVGLGDAGEPLDTTLPFDPLIGCEDPASAFQRATDLMGISGGTDKGSGNERGYWEGQARRVLTAFLHAAAIGNRSMLDVYTWVADPDAHKAEIMRLLLRGDVAAYVPDVEQFIATNNDTRSSITTGVMPALAWLTSKSAIAAATPGAKFDVEKLLTERAAIYLIGDPETQTDPLVRALTGYLVREARRLAGRTRLDPPLTSVSDEAGLLGPPLERWTADMGGRGVTIVAAFQSRAQMLTRWTGPEAGTIQNNAGTTILLGGTGDEGDLRYWVMRVGERDEPVITTDNHGRPSTRSVRKVPVLSATQINGMPEFQAVVFHGGMPPALCRIQAGWERPEMRPGSLRNRWLRLEAWLERFRPDWWPTGQTTAPGPTTAAPSPVPDLATTDLTKVTTTIGA